LFLGFKINGVLVSYGQRYHADLANEQPPVAMTDTFLLALGDTVEAFVFHTHAAAPTFLGDIGAYNVTSFSGFRVE
jgi:hypothetical protein